MAPDERAYCGAYWCDGDHLASTERCAERDHPDEDGEPEHPLVTEVPC